VWQPILSSPQRSGASSEQEQGDEEEDDYETESQKDVEMATMWSTSDKNNDQDMLATKGQQRANNNPKGERISSIATASTTGMVWLISKFSRSIRTSL
jgi:hypothetical protein